MQTQNLTMAVKTTEAFQEMLTEKYKGRMIVSIGLDPRHRPGALITLYASTVVGTEFYRNDMVLEATEIIPKLEKMYEEMCTAIVEEALGVRDESEKV